MDILGFLRKGDEKRNVAYGIASTTFDELLEGLDLKERYDVGKYGLPKIGTKKLEDAVGEYDPDTHRLNLDTSFIGRYLDIDFRAGEECRCVIRRDKTYGWR